MASEELSFAQLSGQAVVRFPGPLTEPHGRFLEEIRDELNSVGFPKTAAHLDIPRELTSSLFNPMSEHFPTWDALYLLLMISGVHRERISGLLERWRLVVDAYLQNRPSVPSDFAEAAKTARHRHASSEHTDLTISTPVDLPNPVLETRIARPVVRRRTTKAARQPVPVLRDAEGFEDLQPDPLQATTVPEFLETMRYFHIWAGEESFRELSRIAHGAFGASTISETLSPANTKRLPSLRVVKAFVMACGGDVDDVTRWTTAWRRIRLRQTGNNKARSSRLREVDTP